MSRDPRTPDSDNADAPEKDGDREVVGHVAGHDVESRERKNRPLSDYYICRRCGKTRNTVDEFQSVSCNRKLVTDGGDRFAERADELYRDAIDEVDSADPHETMLYARCCAAAEVAANRDDVPMSGVLGVMTAALREAAEQSGFDFEDVLDRARDVHVEESE